MSDAQTLSSWTTNELLFAVAYARTVGDACDAQWSELQARLGSEALWAVDAEVAELLAERRAAYGLAA